MDGKIIRRLFLIASVGLVAAGILFLCLSIFTEPKNTTYLCIALACIVLSNVFSILRIQADRRRKRD